MDCIYKNCVIVYTSVLQGRPLTPEQPTALEAKMTWNPIETAPTDGTEILLYSAHSIRYSGQQVGHWDNGNFVSVIKMGGVVKDKICALVVINTFPATHWKPLEQPPEK